MVTMNRHSQTDSRPVLADDDVVYIVDVYLARIAPRGGEDCGGLGVALL